MRWLLRASLAVNAALGLALARRLRHRAMLKAGVINAPEQDFAAVARETFAPAEAGSVAFVGDSHVALGPWLEVLTPYRNRGISGAKIADVSTWIDNVLADRPSRLVLMIGSNDVYFGVPRAQSMAAARQLFDRIAEQAGCPVTVVSLPPIKVERRSAKTMNTALRKLADERGFGWLDIHSTLARMDWTVDGLHLTPAAYRAVAPAFVSALDGRAEASAGD